jgi:hypothetical protein
MLPDLRHGIGARSGRFRRRAGVTAAHSAVRLAARRTPGRSDSGAAANSGAFKLQEISVSQLWHDPPPRRDSIMPTGHGPAAAPPPPPTPGPGPLPG